MKTAVVTGANTGIGLAIAERLLKDGFALGYATAGDDEKHTGPLEALQATYGERNVTHVFGDLSDPATPATPETPKSSAHTRTYSDRHTRWAASGSRAPRSMLSRWAPRTSLS